MKKIAAIGVCSRDSIILPLCFTNSQAIDWAPSFVLYLSMSHSPPPPDPSTVEVLPRVLGPFDAVTIVVGSIIGSGIFLKVSNIDNQVPAFGAIMAGWILGGIATLCGSLSLAELAAMLPH